MNVNEVTSLNPLLLADSSEFDFSLNGCIERSKKAGGTYGDPTKPNEPKNRSGKGDPKDTKNES